MQIPEEAFNLIRHFEGVELTAYQDPVGVWTIGFGHTRTARPGMTLSISEAEALLIEDAQNVAEDLRRLVKVPLNPNEFGALLSLTFNLGAGALARSTALKRLNTGDRFGCAEALTWWTYAGGRVLPGLVRRRQAERALFLKPYRLAPLRPSISETGENTRLTAEEARPLTVHTMPRQTKRPRKLHSQNFNLRRLLARLGFSRAE